VSHVKFVDTYEHIISVENLLEAWKEFILGKKGRKDAQEFQRNLMSHIISIHNDLADKTYTHSAYEAFNISDPKPRNIHKAKVRDRLLHHALYRKLYPYFDKRFIYNSYSCRVGKGSHRALNQFRKYSHKVSKNYTRTAWILKCDIRKFFASIDHNILLNILDGKIQDKNIMWLLTRIISSFYSTENGKGLPLGNLTSHLLVNIYMNEFDQFAKHGAKAKYYIRYADDFMVMDASRNTLEDILSRFHTFLNGELKLSLHPDKVFVKTLASGVDFLGWVHFPGHRVLRAATRKRMLRNLTSTSSKEQIASYVGLMKHGNAHRLCQKVLDYAVKNVEKC
jgi:RNA-directed DNA polymerase